MLNWLLVETLREGGFLMKQQVNERTKIVANGNTLGFLSGKEPLQVKFRYDEIHSTVQKRSCSLSNIETVYKTPTTEQCIVKNMSVIGCKVLVWFDKGYSPKVCLVSDGYLARIDITRIIRDTSFYGQLCDRKLA